MAISVLRHLLDIESLSPNLIFSILDKANEYLYNIHSDHQSHGSHKIVCNAFFEPSTRTRCSFELAAKRLGIEVINFDASTSSTLKGESLLDTFKALTAMKIDAFIVRHQKEGIPAFLSENLPPSVSIINAGDGHHAHPTQALLDLMTIYQHFPKLENLSIAIVGDISHSRVARSQLALFRKLGIKDIRLIAPSALITAEFRKKDFSYFDNLNEGLKDIDVIIALRIQKERMHSADIPNFSEYYLNYGIKPENLLYAKKGAIVMHPGPINREIDIASQVADGSQSVILKQITNGVAIRMAVLKLTLL